MEKKCTECGYQLIGNETECPNCGRPINERQEFDNDEYVVDDDAETTLIRYAKIIKLVSFWLLFLGFFIRYGFIIDSRMSVGEKSLDLLATLIIVLIFAFLIKVFCAFITLYVNISNTLKRIEKKLK